MQEPCECLWTYEICGCAKRAGMQMTQVSQILTVYVGCKKCTVPLEREIKLVDAPQNWQSVAFRIHIHTNKHNQTRTYTPGPAELMQAYMILNVRLWLKNSEAVPCYLLYTKPGKNRVFMLDLSLDYLC